MILRDAVVSDLSRTLTVDRADQVVPHSGAVRVLSAVSWTADVREGKSDESVAQLELGDAVASIPAARQRGI